MLTLGGLKAESGKFCVKRISVKLPGDIISVEIKGTTTPVSLILAVTWLIKNREWDCCCPSAVSLFAWAWSEAKPVNEACCIWARSSAASIKMLPAATLNEIKKRQIRIARDLFLARMGWFYTQFNMPGGSVSAFCQDLLIAWIHTDYSLSDQ